MVLLDIAGAVSAGRELAEARMSDRCVLYAETDGGVWDPTTESYGSADLTVYSGRCRVKAVDAMANESDAGETSTPVLRIQVHIPTTVVGVAVGHRIRVTYAADLPSMDAVVFRVTSLFRSSQATAQRLECSETQ